jgi:hypothetical protein
MKKFGENKKKAEAMLQEKQDYQDESYSYVDDSHSYNQSKSATPGNI